MIRVRKALAKVDLRLRSLSFFKFVLVFNLLIFAVSTLFALLTFIVQRLFSLGSVKSEALTFEDGILVVAVLVAPLIETLIFQHGVIRLMRAIPPLRDKSAIIMGTSALLFGFAHHFTPIDILHMSVIGLLFAYAYVIHEPDQQRAFWSVAGIHALRNGLAAAIGFLIMRS